MNNDERGGVNFMDERIKEKPDLKKLIEFLLQNPTFIPPEAGSHADEKGLLAWLYNLIFGH